MKPSIEADRKASLRRLKQRLWNAAGFRLEPYDQKKLNAAVDAWDAAERKRGCR